MWISVPTVGKLDLREWVLKSVEGLEIYDGKHTKTFHINRLCYCCVPGLKDTTTHAKRDDETDVSTRDDWGIEHTTMPAADDEDASILHYPQRHRRLPERYQP